MKKLIIPTLFILLGVMITACTVNKDGKLVLTDRPIAKAGAYKNANTGSLVILDGSQSYSPNPDKIITYKWTLKSYPGTNDTVSRSNSEQESVIVLKDSNTSHPNFIAIYDGVYVLSLVVSDGTLESDPSEVKVNAITTIVNNKGFTYNAVVSPYTSSIWLDRNLGALKVCSSLDDELCYGDYYQWGRTSDGHEKRDSNITSVIASEYDVGHADFITLSNDYETWVRDDSRSGFLSYPSDVCPSGYHVATQIEMNLELTQRSSIFFSANVDLETLTATQAFESFLKLPLSGYKDHSNGVLIDEGILGGVWTATADLYGNPLIPSTRSDKSRALYFNDSNLSFYSKSRADAYPIRCVKYGLSGATNALEVINSAPVANAGVMQNSLTGKEVTLDGSKSYDPNGDSITYLWSIVQVPQELPLELSDVTSVKPTFIAEVEGEYIFNLTVNDTNLSSQLSQVTVNVVLANIAPIADVGSSIKMVTTNSLVELNGTKSSDINGDALSYLWRMDRKPPRSMSELSASQSPFPTFTPDVDGTYMITLVVNDGEFNSQSSTVDVEARTLNIAPIANAGADQKVDVDEEVILDASQSSDANADTLSYLWNIQLKPVDSNVTLNNTTLRNPSFFPDVAGVYTISLTVNDGVLDSAVDTIDINVTQNSAPIAEAGLSRTVTLNETVRLDASASTDKDGSALTYLWSLVSKPQGSSASLSSTTAINPTFTADVEGTYHCSLVVNNGTLNSQIDTITLHTVKTLSFKGLTYKTTLSPVTGKVWLDRNLGATQVCTALDDTECYGDYYQWGRAADGHEKVNSSRTSTLASDINAANANFITKSNNPYDWIIADPDGSLRTFEWSKTDGSSICPVGYRVPTMDELAAETVNASTPIQNNTDAFNNFLKFPSAGYRNNSDASINSQGSNGYGMVWSSSVSGSYSQFLNFSSGYAGSYDGYRARGFSARCIEDIFAPVGDGGF